MQMSDLMSNGKEQILWDSGENETDLRRRALQPIARTTIKETGAEWVRGVGTGEPTRKTLGATEHDIKNNIATV